MNDRDVLTAAPSREEPEDMRPQGKTRRFLVALREQLYRMFMARAGLALPSTGAPGRQLPQTRPFV